MYLLNVKAAVSKEQYIAQKEAHGAWVKEGFSKGWFLFAGPKQEELGGFILVKDIDKTQLETFISEDPFMTENLAEYDIQAFSIALAAEGLETLKSN